MKKTVLILLVTVFPALLFSSCLFLGSSVKGNGNVVKEERDITGFNGIKASRGVNVYVSQGDEEKVMVEADENLVDLIETEVDDSMLKVTIRRRIRESTSCKVHVTVSGLKKVQASAGSNIYSEHEIHAGNMELSASAGSNIKMEITAQALDISASAGSNIFLEGASREVKVQASAGSNVKAEELITEVCKAKAGSGANIYITVNEKLDGNASSGGNVFYSGNPRHLDTASSSGGNVRKN
jgi:hypothetical protein